MLRSGHAAPVCRAWRSAGLFERAYPGLAGRPDEDDTVLDRIDAAIERGAVLDDATLIGAFFLHRFYREFDDLVRDGRKLDNVEMLRRIEQILEPVSTNLRVANHTVHLVDQGLFALTKMHRQPERGRQVLKLARQQYFPVVWDLYRLAAVVGLVPEKTRDEWSRAVSRVTRGDDRPSPDSGDRKPPRRRRPRRRRRR